MITWTDTAIYYYYLNMSFPSITTKFCQFHGMSWKDGWQKK